MNVDGAITRLLCTRTFKGKVRVIHSFNHIMMKTLSRLLFLFCFLSISRVMAQGPEERLYIQTDRNHYSKGETVYFKGYVIPGEDTLFSTHMYVELWDQAFQKLAEICLPLTGSTVSGSISIPSSLATEEVLLRAYTDITSTQAHPFQFVKALTGHLQENPPVVTGPVFFPESGKLVAGAINYVAFKAGPDFSGSIRNSKGEPVLTIRPGFRGMGIFRFRPVHGEKYVCHWENAGKSSETALPALTESGVSLHVNQFGDTLYFDLDRGDNKDPAVLKPKVQLWMGNRLGYSAEIDLHELSTFSHMIPLGKFQSGMALVKLVDAENRVLASRPVFIPRKSLQAGTSLETAELDPARRGNNRFRLLFGDTALSFAAVSITDADHNAPAAGYGILQYVLPDGLPFEPALEETEDMPEKLDLLILTSGIRLPERGASVVKTTSDRSMRLSGQVRDGKKILAGKELMVVIRSAFSGRNFYKVRTDEQGRFTIDNLLIYGEAFVYCKLPGSSRDDLDFDLQVSLPPSSQDPAFLEAFRKKVSGWHKVPVQEKKAGDPLSQPAMDIADSILFAEKAIVLEEAVVRTNARQLAQKRLEELEKRYLDGTPFSGYNSMAETVDVMNDPVAGKYNEVLPYIASRMHSIKIRYERGRQELFYPIRGINGDTIIRTYILNGVRITRDLVDGIRLDEIALVKFIPMLGSEPGLPPSVIIYLKKPGDQGYWEKDKYQSVEKKISGYTLPKEFPLPDYSRSDIKVERDSRKTLYWNPYLPVQDGKAEIRFYNNDITRRFRVYVEGITTEGNLIRFETELD